MLFRRVKRRVKWVIPCESAKAFKLSVNITEVIPLLNHLKHLVKATPGHHINSVYMYAPHVSHCILTIMRLVLAYRNTLLWCLDSRVQTAYM